MFKISRIDSKITQHTKNHENFNSHRKRQSTDANADMMQMEKLCDKDFKAATI